MWFGISLLLRGEESRRSKDEWLWEECIVVVEADSADAAALIGETLGKRSEQEYVAAAGGTVRWVFDRVERTYQIDADKCESGAEVFSRFLRASEVKSLLTPFEDETERHVRHRS
jgi:hypothetical protein